MSGWVQEHITALPAEVLSTPLGQMIAPSLAGACTLVLFEAAVSGLSIPGWLAAFLTAAAVESKLSSVHQRDEPLQLSAGADSILPALEASSSADAAVARSGVPHAPIAVPPGQARDVLHSMPSTSCAVNKHIDV